MLKSIRERGHPCRTHLPITILLVTNILLLLFFLPSGPCISSLLFESIYLLSFQSTPIQGRRPRRGTGGTVPPKFLGGGTAHAMVPPIFREVVLSDARESTNRVNKWCCQGILFGNSGFSGEEEVVYDI